MGMWWAILLLPSPLTNHSFILQYLYNNFISMKTEEYNSGGCTQYSVRNTNISLPAQPCPHPHQQPTVADWLRCFLSADLANWLIIQQSGWHWGQSKFKFTNIQHPPPTPSGTNQRSTERNEYWHLYNYFCKYGVHPYICIIFLPLFRHLILSIFVGIISV